jgi:hypothetical protein
MSIKCRAAFVALAFVAPAQAQVVFQERPGHLTCTAPAGMYERRDVAELAAGGRMAGRIRILEPYRHHRWLPIAGFHFTVPQGRESTAGVHIAADPTMPGTLLLVLRVPRRDDSSVVLGRVSSSNWIPVSVSLNDRVLEVQIAGRTVRRRVRRDGVEPRLICSSGVFEFELEEGMRLAPEAPQPPSNQ